MEMEKETIYLTETFRTTQSMKKRINDFSKKIGENKSELIRSALNFMMAYFNNPDDFEIQKYHILSLLMDYEIKRLGTFKYGEHFDEFIEVRDAAWQKLPDIEEKAKKLKDKISKEIHQEIEEKFADFLPQKSKDFLA